MNIHFSFKRYLIITSCILLAACANKPVPPNTLAVIENELDKQYPDIQFSGLLTRQQNSINSQGKLSLQQSLQIMLTRSPQVSFYLAEVGIANAETLQADIIKNPHISIAALKPEDGGRWSLETGISQPLLSLFTRPLRKQLAKDALIKVQLDLQGKFQKLIMKTSQTYFSAVAAQQNLQVQQHMHQATLARQQLAQAMYQAGNISENKFLYYQHELQLAEKELQKRQALARHTQLQLANILGLSSTQLPELPNQLPGLPDEDFDHQYLVEQAKVSRVDIKITQQQLAYLQKRKQLISKDHGWRDMEVGINVEREFDGATNIGPEIEFALPLFNRGQGKIAAIDSKTLQRQAQMHKLILDTDIQIAQAINQLESAKKQLATINTALQIAEKRVSLSNQEVNFMLSSPFELLAIKRQEIKLAHQFTQELKKYWHARSQLELAVGKSLPIIEKREDVHKHHQMDHSTMDHSDKHSMDKHQINKNHKAHSNHQEHDHD